MLLSYYYLYSYPSKLPYLSPVVVVHSNNVYHYVLYASSLQFLEAVFQFVREWIMIISFIHDE